MYLTIASVLTLPSTASEESCINTMPRPTVVISSR